MRISFVHELDSIVYSVPRSTSELEVRAFELPLLSAGSYLSSHSYSMKERSKYYDIHYSMDVKCHDR